MVEKSVDLCCQTFGEDNAVKSKEYNVMIPKDSSSIVPCSSTRPTMTMGLDECQPTGYTLMGRHGILSACLDHGWMVEMARIMKEHGKVACVLGVRKSTTTRWMDSHWNACLKRRSWIISGRHCGGVGGTSRTKTSRNEDVEEDGREDEDEGGGESCC